MASRSSSKSRQKTCQVGPDKPDKKGLKSGGVLPQLTRVEQDVLHLLTDENLTIQQVALRRKTSLNAIYKTCERLRKKGVLGKHNNLVRIPGVAIQPRGGRRNGIRLHAQRFRVRLLWGDKRYQSLRQRSNVLYVDDNTVMLYDRSLVVISGHSFWGDDVQRATAESMAYWHRFLVRLENDTHTILLKSRSQNIKLTNAHYAEVHNELARDCAVRAEQVKLYTREDGRLWFLIDNSWNFNEMETVHPETSGSDMERVVPTIEDLRARGPFKISEVVAALHAVVQANAETARGLQALTEVVRLELSARAGPLGGPSPSSSSSIDPGVPSYVG